MMSFAQWGNALYSGKKSYGIVAHRKLFVGLAGGLMVLSAVLIAVLGLNPSIEFTGGSQFSVTGVSTSQQQVAYDAVAKTGVTSDVRVSNLGQNGVRVQTPALDTEQTGEVRQALASAYGVDVNDVQASSIGPTWGHDVTAKAMQSLVIFLVLVALVMAVYFRSLTMSAAAIIALLHDVVVTVAFFAITQVEVSPATLIGYLTILGYSLYDTVVVFDKIREHTRGVWDQERYTFGELVNLAVNQTMVRSINTSVVALLPVGCILFIGTFLLGAGTLTDISLALFVGMIVGAYSSIFIAAPLLVILEDRRRRTREHNGRVLAARAARAAATTGEEVPAGASASVRVAPLTPGRHLGQAAQPTRKNRRNR
ncbi:protein translocase subunit SecF [Actinomyces polynesiensis]|uniref:protein translocase subunit SecF n=1 Tax=Actinomyces polynesiensis TaxID=1325934 RepID=UPI0005BA17EE|nr:protein translocase subunit SecF [Actinomyces polynesiensis]